MDSFSNLTFSSLESIARSYFEHSEVYPRNLEHGSGDNIHHAEDEFRVLTCETPHHDGSVEGGMLNVMITRRRLTNQDCRAGHATKLRERQEQPSHGTEEVVSIPTSTEDMVDGRKLWNKGPDECNIESDKF